MDGTALQNAHRQAQTELIEGTGAAWKDSKRSEFNQRYWLPIDEASGQYLIALTSLERAVRDLTYFIENLPSRH